MGLTADLSDSVIKSCDVCSFSPVLITFLSTFIFIFREICSPLLQYVLDLTEYPFAPFFVAVWRNIIHVTLSSLKKTEKISDFPEKDQLTRIKDQYITFQDVCCQGSSLRDQNSVRDKEWNVLDGASNIRSPFWLKSVVWGIWNFTSKTDGMTCQASIN